MDIEIDSSAEDRTPEQNARIRRYYAAADILRAAGIKVSVSKCIVTKPTDDPASISII